MENKEDFLISYQDVLPGQPYYEDVVWMQDQGYIAPAGKFHPDRAITLAESITIEERVFSVPSVINSWSEWNGETYWLRDGKLSVGYTNYAADTNADSVAATIFGAVPNSKDVIWSHEFEEKYNIDTSAIFYDSLKVYGVVDEWYAENTTISRGEFCHIIRNVVETDALSSDKILCIDEEFKIFTHGYTEDELSQWLKDDILIDVHWSLYQLPEDVLRAYLDSSYSIHVVNVFYWNEVKAHHITADYAAAFVSGKEIWIGEQFLYDRTILIHEMGHVCHNMAGFPKDLLETFFKDKDRICTMTGDGYAATNSSECFAEAFMVYVVDPALWNQTVPDLTPYMEEMIGLMIAGDHVLLN